MKILEAMHDAKRILVDLEVALGDKKKMLPHYVSNTKEKLFL